MRKGRTPSPYELPRIEAGQPAVAASAAGLPPLSPPPQSPGQHAYRRHTRKRSSTIYLPPRAAAPPSAPVAAAPLAPGLLRGVTTLAGAQLLAKLLVFVLNQLLLRFVGARDLGAAAQLDLLVTTTLALSRDAVRLASQRQAPARLTHVSEYTTDGRAVLDTVLGALQQTVNLGWVAGATGSLLIAATSAWLVARRMWPGDAAFVYVFAALLELATEPCFLLAQLQLRLGLRAKAESLATVARVCMVALALVAAQLPPILGFAFGQLAFAATLAAVYYLATITEKRRAGFSLLPARVWTSQDQTKTVFVARDVYKTSMELGVQQIVKFFLTEGDKFAVGLMTTLEQQGQYALASNYGSLLARMLLFPVEEALRSYFSRVLPKPKVSAEVPAMTRSRSRSNSVRQHSPAVAVANTGINAGAGTGTSTGASAEAGTGPNAGSSAGPNAGPNAGPSVGPSVGPSAGPAAAVDYSTPSPTTTVPEEADAVLEKVPVGPIATLTSVLRAYTYLGLLAVGFGPLVAQYLLSWVVQAARFGDAPAVLAAYATYIPILAWNGVLEAVVQSVGSLAQLRRQGVALTVIAVAFVVFVYIFVSIMQLGAVGLVYAQILAMSMRSAWSLHFATAYFNRGPAWLCDCMPHWSVLATAAAAISAARFVGPVATFPQFCLDCVLASTIVGAVALAEREQLRTVYTKTKGAKAQ